MVDPPRGLKALGGARRSLRPGSTRYVPEGGRTSKTRYVPRRSGEKPKKALKYSLRPTLVREDYGT